MVPRLSQFELVEQCGRGAMAEVWRARDLETGEPVAIKVVTAEAALKPRYRSRFTYEVRATAQIQHPGVIQLFDHGEVPASLALKRENFRQTAPYLVMEWVAGGTLRDQLGRLTWPEIRGTLLSLLDVLAASHSHEIIHRDLKPDNVLLSERGPLLSDFGVAFSAQESATVEANHTMVGTPNYMAPEQIQGNWRAFGPWTDLYALGCLAFALITGRAPYACTNFNDVVGGHLRGEIPPLEPEMPIPEGLSFWLERLLSKRISGRFQLAADAAKALLAYPSMARDVDFSESEARGEAPRDDRSLFAPRVLVPSNDVHWYAEHSSQFECGMPQSWLHPAQLVSRPPIPGVGKTLFGLATAPFCGREDERDVLWRELADVVNSRVLRLCSIRGPAGQGKTTLAEWIARRAHQLGVALPHRIRHEANGGLDSGLAGFLNQFFRLNGLSTQEAYRRLSRHCEGLGLADYEQTFATICSLSSEGERARLHGVREAYESLARLFHVLGEQRPRILLIDDAHWGPDTLGFIEYLTDKWPRLPILVLMTLPDQVPSDTAQLSPSLLRLNSSPAMTTISLGPLSPASHAEMLGRQLLLEKRVVDYLASRTRGNPLFAQEIVRHWIDRGDLVLGDHGFQLRGNHADELPEHISSLWQLRIDHAVGATEDALSALEIAAILGHRIDPSELESASELAGITWSLDHLRCWVDAGLVIPKGAGRWTFSHGLLRESLYESARRNERFLRWNSVCADLLSQETEPQTKKIGLLLYSAQRYQDAYAPLIESAANQRRSSRYRRAQHLTYLAARCIRKGAFGRKSVQWAKVLSQSAGCLRVQGFFEVSLRRARRVVSLVEPCVAENGALMARGLVEVARCLDAVQSAEASIPYLKRACEVAEEAGAIEILLTSLVSLSRAYRLFGDYVRARDAAELCLQVCDPGQHPLIYGTSLMNIARIDIGEGHPQRGTARARDAVAYVERSGSKWAQAQIWNIIGDAERAAKNFSKAEAAHVEATGILKQIGSFDSVYGGANLALIQMEQGRWEAAHATMDKAVVAADRLGHVKARLMINCIALWHDAKRERWSDWDQKSVLLQGMNERALADPDLAWTLLGAAREAGKRGQPERSEFAWDLALRQYELLSRTEELAALRNERSRARALLRHSSEDEANL